MQGMPVQESNSHELIGANKTVCLTEEDIPERRNFDILNGILQGMQYWLVSLMQAYLLLIDLCEVN